MSKYVSLIGALLLLCVVPFFLKDAQGEPIMSWAFIQQQLGKGLEPFQEAADGVKDAAGVETEPTPSGIYKWQDKNGKWHFGDAPRQGAEEVRINPNVNIVQLPTAKKPDEEESSGPSVTVLKDKNTADANDIGLSANPLERIKDGIELKSQVDELTKQIEARNKAMDEAFLK